jgi:uncharacterized protein YjbJ (UPF0337 family)
MNWDTIGGKWDQFKGEMRIKWGKLTDDDFEQAKGQRDKLVGKITEHYGQQKDQVERDLDHMMSKL